MGLFNFTAKSQVVTTPEYESKVETTGSNQFFGFSTPFGVIGKGNLSLPHIDKSYTTSGFIRFGTDNLYPQLLNQLYFMSAIHSACIDMKTNAVTGGGYTIGENKTLSTDNKIDIKKFETINKLKKTVRSITRDWFIHDRITLIIKTDKNGKILYFKRIDPAKVRSNGDCTKYIVSDDWSKGMVNVKTYNSYDVNSRDCETLLEWKKDSPGQDVYPIPSYNSILNLAALDNDIAFFMKNNIKNSVFFSAVVTKKQPFKSLDERRDFKQAIEDSKGSEMAGSLLVLTGTGGDDIPEYTPLQSNRNDDMFINTDKILTEKIAIAHRTHTGILGIKVQGQLGNVQELQMAYQIFEKNTVKPERTEIEDLINFLLSMSQISFDFKFNEFAIIDDVIVDKVANTSAKANGVTINEDYSEESIVVNEHLRGLNAKENMDIVRIVRDFNKGKLNFELAKLRLQSYGIDENAIKAILKKNDK